MRTQLVVAMVQTTSDQVLEDASFSILIALAAALAAFEWQIWPWPVLSFGTAWFSYWQLDRR